MSDVTVEAEIERGRIAARKPEKLSENASEILAIFPSVDGHAETFPTAVSKMFALG